MISAGREFNAPLNRSFGILRGAPAHVCVNETALRFMIRKQKDGAGEMDKTRFVLFYFSSLAICLHPPSPHTP